MANDMGSGGNRSGQETIRTLTWAVKGSPTVLPRPNSTLITLREDIFCQLRQLQRRQRVISEGFITTQLPAASAGASFRAAIISG